MCGGGGGGQPAPKAEPKPAAASVSVAPAAASAPPNAVASEGGSSRASRAKQARMMNGNNRNRFKVDLAVSRANVGGDGRSGLNIPSTRG